MQSKSLTRRTKNGQTASSLMLDYPGQNVLNSMTIRVPVMTEAPAGDMPNATAMAQSFSLANMVPQAPQNNRKSWAGIEKATRKYVRRAKGDVYVITGPVFGAAAPNTIGPDQVWVPQYLFKLVYDSTTHRAWAHWIENSDSARTGQPITYRELVKRTGVDVLPGVPIAE